MSEKEKLQKAVEATIAAGYQISREAFEFLNMVATTDDPIIIMEKALKRTEQLEEKPLFISREFLEELFKESELLKETMQQQMIKGKSVFHPYAKDVEASIDIIEDPTNKISSNGTVEGYLKYFRDRFKRIERLFRKRLDTKIATPIIEALKTPANTKLKIIGMITKKRETKQRIMFTVEDLQANATVFVTRKASNELKKKAQLVLPDQIVCLAVIKTRNNLFFAEDIIFPEIGQKTQNRSPEPVYAVLTSDMHVGSLKFQRDAFNRFVLWLNGKYGNGKMRQIAKHVKYVLVAGDIVDGIGVYPNQIKELKVTDINKQYMLAGKFFEQIPDYIEVIIIPGNHDASRKALPQPAISNDYLKILQGSRKFHSLGNPSFISLHKVEILLYHGRSLDDIISTVPSIDHGHPEKAMKLLLQNRHLAPLYGGKTMLSPETKDFLVLERIPDVFHAGHVHVLGFCNYRGVLTINSGCWQEQTDYMQKRGLVPTPGKVPVVNLQTLKVTVLPFC